MNFVFSLFTASESGYVCEILNLSKFKISWFSADFALLETALLL